MKWLNEIHESDRDLVGSKALNLAKLRGLNLNVPDGFVITTKECRKFVRNGLKNRFLAELHENSKILGSLAVRSSSISEDSKLYSFAGQYETMLNVKPTDLLSAIRFCATPTKRALEYCKARRVTDQLAILIQKMIKPKYAGVMFTTEPIKKRPDILAVEIVKGSGEKLVSGQVIPTALNIHKNGTVLHTSGEIKLPPKIIIKLCDTARIIENKFKNPQDIEFVIDKNNDLWIVQTRPITTL